MLADIDIEKLKYPSGKFVAMASFDEKEVKKQIHALEILPVYLAQTVKGLSHKELLYKYRPEGWNVKQIVHHVADSHLNFHIRLRLTLTEETPTVKPYDENTWAKLVDANNDDLSGSLQIINGVHKRALELLNRRITSVRISTLNTTRNSICFGCWVYMHGMASIIRNK